MSDIELIERSVQHITSDVNRVYLSDKTKQVSDHVAGYVLNKLQKFREGCWEKRLSDENLTSGVFHKLLPRGGLGAGFLALKNYVPLGFAILDACETTICKSNVPALKVVKHLQQILA